jgi:hypothetical protein
MPTFRKRLRALPRRIASAILLCGITVTGACTTVRGVPADYISTKVPDVVWVTHSDTIVVPVAQPDISRDTLRGMLQGTQEPVAIPMDQVRIVKAKVPDHRKTVLLVVGWLSGFAASVYTLWISKAGPNSDGVFCPVYGSATEGPTGSGSFRPYC